MLIFDGHGSHVSNEFLFYCWEDRIVPFQLPPHSTHLLQPLDIGMFQPLKHWQQEDIHEQIKYGEMEYTKVDFLNAYEKVRRKTFVSRTILSSFRKAGLSPFRPEIVYEKMRVFHASEGQRIPDPLPPVRPTTRKPFEHPPKTPDRAAHRTYLDQRMADAETPGIDLTPSYHR